MSARWVGAFHCQLSVTGAASDMSLPVGAAEGLPMSTLFSSKSPRSKRMIFAFALMAGSGISAVAVAQSSPQTSPAASQTNETPANSTASSTDHRLIKPGDRTCLRHTGSLIPPKKGDCLPVAGRSYGGDELRNTGAIDNAHALQMLDPSISLGH